MAALIAAMAKKSLRETLDVEDFTGPARLVAQSLKDGKSKDARRVVKEWLSTIGVALDDKTDDIGAAVINSLKETNRLRRAHALLRDHERNLRYPNLAGPKAVAESMRLVQQLEEISRGQLQQGDPGGECDTGH